MNANFASIMPQVVAVWCRNKGHEVSLLCYTGFEDLSTELPQELDLVFIGAFTESAQVAYALSNRFHAQGVVTVLGGPHARCYPQDAQKYFDYVLGFTDEGVIDDVLRDCARQTPQGVLVSAAKQPTSLPGLRERWEFLEPTLRKARLIQIVPMIGSVGCPYTCSFCIDSTVGYQMFDADVVKDDLRFLITRYKRPLVAWHDPNFGVRFDEMMDAIEESIPPDRVDFIAESSLSLLSEQHLLRLKRNGFKALLPGIESWYDLGDKSRAGRVQGMEKVQRVAEHVNLILRHIPYVQTNFVLGMDGDSGSEPFELTKRFVDLTPGAFPGYSLLSAFGQAAPVNLDYQREGRVIGFPFHFLNNHGAMNIRPKNYSWPAFYDKVIGLTQHSFSPRNVLRRFAATDASIPRWMNLIRAISSEGHGRIRYYTAIRQKLQTDASFRAFFDQQTKTLPSFYVDRVRNDLGFMWQWLPEGALYHDQNAYLHAQTREGNSTSPSDRRVAREFSEAPVGSQRVRIFET